MSTLTVAYITSRSNCQIEWFFDSLALQAKERAEMVRLIVVDHFHGRVGECPEDSRDIRVRNLFDKAFERIDAVMLHRAPKPNVWNGEHRLTKEDWFAAASMRNTAICLCRTSHIAFVDDLSVLCPGWLDAVYEAVEGNYIGCGAYRKVNDLLVKDGSVVQFTATDAGIDHRLQRVDQNVSPCDGGWAYGCSIVGPMEAFLEINGWPEDLCDGTGAEDYCAGIALRNAGYSLRFDRRMMTLESDELHFVEPAMKRSDYGVSPLDKSHRCLEIARQSKRFLNSFGEGGIRALRERVLSGESFPIPSAPDREWFTGTLLKDL